MDNATDTILNPSDLIDHVPSKPTTEAKEDNLDLRGIVKLITHSFAQKASRRVRSDYTVANFVVLTHHPYVLGISSDGYLIIINLVLFSVHNIKLATYLDEIVTDVDETVAFLYNTDGKFIMIQIPTWKVISTVNKIRDDFTELIFLPPNNLVAVNDDAHIYTFEWDRETIKQSKVVKCTVKEPYQAILSKDGEFVLVKTETHLILFDTKGSKKHEIPQKDTSYKMCFSPKSTYFAITQTLKKRDNTKKQVEIYLISNPKSVKIRKKVPDGQIISGIYFSTDEGYLMGTSKKGDIFVWELFGQKREVVLPVHSSSISHLSFKSWKIYSSDSKDNYFCITNFPEFPNDSRTKFNYADEYLELPGLNRAIFINDEEITELDLDTYSFTSNRYEHQVGAAKYSAILNSVLLGTEISDKYVITQWNLEYKTEEVVIEQLEDQTSSLELSADESLLYIGGTHQKILIYSTATWSLIKELTGHKGDITTMLLVDSRLYSGSGDNTIRVWFINQDYDFKEFSGHKKGIRSVKSFQNRLFTSSTDVTIGVWSTVDYSNITFLEGHGSQISDIYLSANGKYLYAMDTSNILKLWSLETYDCIFSEKYDGFERFVLPANEKKLILLGDEEIQVSDNPMNGDKIQVTGISEKAKFVQYINDILSTKVVPEHNRDLDRGVITPYIITPLHLFAYLNMPKYLEMSLELKSPLLYTSTSDNPLTISVTRAFKECITLIIKNLKKLIQQNSYSLACVTLDVLIFLNNTEYPNLAKLYNLMMMQSTNASLPQFIDESVSTPIYKLSHRIHVYQEDFNLGATDEGKGVIYLESLVQLNFVSGSSDSIRFLRSLMNTKNDAIFKTQFIQSYLAYKWRRLKLFIQIQGFIYLVYLLSVLGLVFIDSGDWDSLNIETYLLLPFALNIFLTLYEFFQMMISFKVYWESLWNYIDLVRSLLTFIYCFEIYVGIDSLHSTDILVALEAFSLLRGISYFRLFPITRYIVNLLTEVIIDLIGFSILLGYTTLSFGILYYMVLNLEDDGIEHYLGASYTLNLGDFDTEDFSWLGWTIFLIASGLNPIIMLNLLIAIIEDTFDRVQESVEVANNKELTDMILEAEVFLFNRRKSKVLEYLKICDSDINEDAQDVWEGKIRILKKLIKKLAKNVRNTGRKVKSFIESRGKLRDNLEETVKTLTMEYQEHDKHLKYLCNKAGISLEKKDSDEDDDDDDDDDDED